MNSEVEFHIRHNYAWPKLPQNVRQVLLLARLDVCLLVYIGHPQKTGAVFTFCTIRLLFFYRLLAILQPYESCDDD